MDERDFWTRNLSDTVAWMGFPRFYIYTTANWIILNWMLWTFITFLTCCWPVDKIMSFSFFNSSGPTPQLSEKTTWDTTCSLGIRETGSLNLSGTVRKTKQNKTGLWWLFLEEIKLNRWVRMWRTSQNNCGGKGKITFLRKTHTHTKNRARLEETGLHAWLLNMAFVSGWAKLYPSLYPQSDCCICQHIPEEMPPPPTHT